MTKKDLLAQIEWLLLALVISFVLMWYFDGIVLEGSTVFKAQHTFLGLNLFLEILIFFVFSAFVVFGIKGFFEMYSRKTSNIIIFTTGVIVTFVILLLCCQILL